MVSLAYEEATVTNYLKRLLEILLGFRLDSKSEWYECALELHGKSN